MIDSHYRTAMGYQRREPHPASHDHDGTDDGDEVRIKGTLRQRQLARALRQLREDAGLSIEEAAPKLVFDRLRSEALGSRNLAAFIERLAVDL